MQKKKSGVKKCLEICAIKGGRVGPLMANAILNFHFDYLTTSLISFQGLQNFTESPPHSHQDFLGLQWSMRSVDTKAQAPCGLHCAQEIEEIGNCLFGTKELIWAARFMDRITTWLRRVSPHFGVFNALYEQYHFYHISIFSLLSLS